VNRVRIAALLLGVAFGFLLSWGRLTEPEVIRSSLALENFYVFGVMGLAVATGFVGIRAARRFLRTAVLTGEPIAWSTQKPEFRHIAGSVVFGLGWALSDVCPGPLTAQLGQGAARAVPLAIGVVGGVLIYLTARAPAPAAAAPREPGLVPASAPE
jgi:uncharacterized membrane protein YedE/YeeE